VNGAIHLDYETGVNADEVNYEAVNDVLSPELGAQSATA
jgi:hypothetical protein